MANKRIMLSDGSNTLYPAEAGIVPGDTLTFNAYTQFPGSWATTSVLRFLIPLTQIVRAKTITLSGSMYVRCNGKSTSVINLNDATVQTYPTNCGIVVMCTFSSAVTNAEANQPAMIQPANMTATAS